MTRREELKQRADKEGGGLTNLSEDIFYALLQVERDCWDRLITHLDWLIKHNASSGPDDRAASAAKHTYKGLQDWARKQKEPPCDTSSS